jgi:hypothetical protein
MLGAEAFLSFGFVTMLELILIEWVQSLADPQAFGVLVWAGKEEGLRVDTIEPSSFQACLQLVYE